MKTEPELSTLSNEDREELRGLMELLDEHLDLALELLVDPDSGRALYGMGVPVARVRRGQKQARRWLDALKAPARPTRPAPDQTVAEWRQETETEKARRTGLSKAARKERARKASAVDSKRAIAATQEVLKALQKEEMRAAGILAIDGWGDTGGKNVQ